MAIEAFDGHCEKQMRDTGGDKSAGQALSQEATGLGLSAWSNQSDSRSQQANQMLDFTTGVKRDGGGQAVMMDAMTGKLTTQDSKGRTVEYEAHQDQERMSGKNAMGVVSLFMGSPLMLFGMGTTLAMLDQAQVQDQNREVDRLKQNFEGPRPAENQQNRPQQAKGYLDEIAKFALVSGSDKKTKSQQDLSSLLGLGPELYPNQHRIEVGRRKREQELDKKRKGAMDKRADATRKREKRRASVSIERNNISSTKLIKRRRRVENALEYAQNGQSSLAEVSRLHSQLESLDRAIARLSALGL